MSTALRGNTQATEDALCVKPRNPFIVPEEIRELSASMNPKLLKKSVVSTPAVLRSNFSRTWHPCCSPRDLSTIVEAHKEGA